MVDPETDRRLEKLEESESLIPTVYVKPNADGNVIIVALELTLSGKHIPGFIVVDPIYLSSHRIHWMYLDFNIPSTIHI